MTELVGSGMWTATDCPIRPWRNLFGGVTVRAGSFVLTTLTGITVRHKKTHAESRLLAHSGPSVPGGYPPGARSGRCSCYSLPVVLVIVVVL